METVLAGLRECWPAVGYRILDSQHFGVPQRRRRVFFVCGPTEDGVAQVLALTEGGGGDSPAGGDAGAGFTGGLTSGMSSLPDYDAGRVAPMFRHGTGSMTGPMVSILAAIPRRYEREELQQPAPRRSLLPAVEAAHPPLLLGGIEPSWNRSAVASSLRLRERGSKGFGTGARPLRSVPLPYRTMGVAEIAALRVDDLADVDSHLYLWTINRYVEDAYDIARAWGFEPSTLLTWAKRPMGLGPGGAFSITTEHVSVLSPRRAALTCAQQRIDSTWVGMASAVGTVRSRMHSSTWSSASPPVRTSSVFVRRGGLGWPTPGATRRSAM